MVRNGTVFATGTEDMDALTFGASVLVRHLTVSEARKLPIREFRLDRVLSEMELTMEQFVDLCILLGCDYCETIRGIGPKRAVELIRKHGDIETILKHLDKKFSAPENWLFKEARQLFLKPDVTECKEEVRLDVTAFLLFYCFHSLLFLLFSCSIVSIVFILIFSIVLFSLSKTDFLLFRFNIELFYILEMSCLLPIVFSLYDLF